MPRIDFQHETINHWYENEGGGNGSSTFDVCKYCFTDGMTKTAQDLNLTNKGYNGDPIPADALANDTYEGADFDDEMYKGDKCTCCNRTLTNKNYD